ncbi:hypothetical protein BGZ58_001340 [Dissophora ornata]|nr:hypothetical protein BGZ58_001340 [Dissophora ornata]
MVLPDRFLLSIIMWLFLLHAADEAEAGDGQEYGSDDSNYNDPLSSENNTGEPSIASMEPPKRVVRIADPVILRLTKWDVHAEFPAILCKPIRCPQILLYISELSMKACYENHSNTIKEWRRLEREYPENCEEEYSALVHLARSQLEHLLLGAELWSIKTRGKGDHLSCNPTLDKELLFPDYSVTIDFLVVCEAKSPGASQKELDAGYIMLPNMVKLSLDRQIIQDYSKATVFGFHVPGWKVPVF